MVELFVGRWLAELMGGCAVGEASGVKEGREGEPPWVLIQARLSAGARGDATGSRAKWTRLTAFNKIKVWDT